MKSEQILRKADEEASALVTDAESEAEAAAAKAKELQDRVLGGDTAVTAGDLAEAEGEARLKKLRSGAAEGFAKNRKERAHSEAVEALRSELEELLPAGLEYVVEEYEKAIEAIAVFVAKIDGWNDKVKESAARLRNPAIQPLPHSMRVDGGPGLGMGSNVLAGGVEVRLFDPTPLLSEIALRALLVHYQPHELMAYGGRNLEGLAKAAGNSDFKTWTVDAPWVRKIVDAETDS